MVPAAAWGKSVRFARWPVARCCLQVFCAWGLHALGSTWRQCVPFSRVDQRGNLRTVPCCSQGFLTCGWWGMQLRDLPEKKSSDCP